MIIGLQLREDERKELLRYNFLKRSKVGSLRKLAPDVAIWPNDDTIQPGGVRHVAGPRTAPPPRGLTSASHNVRCKWFSIERTTVITLVN